MGGAPDESGGTPAGSMGGGSQAGTMANGGASSMGDAGNAGDAGAAGTDGGPTGPCRKVIVDDAPDTASALNPLPVSTRDGRLTVLWNEQPVGTTTQKIKARRFDGATWSEAKLLTDSGVSLQPFSMRAFAGDGGQVALSGTRFLPGYSAQNFWYMYDPTKNQWSSEQTLDNPYQGAFFGDAYFGDTGALAWIQNLGTSARVPMLTPFGESDGALDMPHNIVLDDIEAWTDIRAITTRTGNGDTWAAWSGKDDLGEFLRLALVIYNNPATTKLSLDGPATYLDLVEGADATLLLFDSSDAHTISMAEIGFDPVGNTPIVGAAQILVHDATMVSSIRHESALELFYLTGGNLTLKRFIQGGWNDPETLGAATSYRTVQAHNGDFYVLMMTDAQTSPRLRRWSYAAQKWEDEVSVDTAGLLVGHGFSLGAAGAHTPVVLGNALRGAQTVDVVALVCDGIP